MVTMADKESENMEHQVFISYATQKGDYTESKDRQVADKVCIALESEGIQCWIAPRNIMPGDDWVNSIIDAVEKSEVVVLIFSSNANYSPWVNDEIKLALDKNIKIIPFRIDDVPPQGALRVLKVRSQWMDAYTPPLEKYLKKLIEVIQRHLGKEPKKTTKKTKDQPEIVKVKADEKDKENKDKSAKEKIKELEEMSKDVRDVASRGIKVEKNKKGLWEAYYQDEIVMVYIPPGEFTMGSNDYDDEKPPHNVFLDGYWMGKYEVTFDQYDKYCEETRKKESYDEGWGRGKRPIINVSWKDAKAYCDWLAKKTGLKFKLPTEAQWEKAARGEDGRKYPWGNRVSKSLANYNFNVGKTSPVGSYPKGASPYGLLDMAGNVLEWCNDWFDKDYYKNSPYKNPLGPENGPVRVSRGGDWSDDADDLRCAYRSYGFPSVRAFVVGFRLCQDNY